MGIDILCKEKSYSCSYSYWHVFRTSIIHATVQYIQEKILCSKDGSIDNTAADEEDDEIIDNFHKDNLLYFVQNWRKDIHYDLNHFVNLCREEQIPISAFIHFGIVGVYTLSWKSDCSCLYSVGNAVDICDLLDKIRPVYEKLFQEDVDIFMQIEEIFRESMELHHAVSVC